MTLFRRKSFHTWNGRDCSPNTSSAYLRNPNISAALIAIQWERLQILLLCVVKRSENLETCIFYFIFKERAIFSAMNLPPDNLAPWWASRSLRAAERALPFTNYEKGFFFSVVFLQAWIQTQILLHCALTRCVAHMMSILFPDIPLVKIVAYLCGPRCSNVALTLSNPTDET